MKSIGGRLRGQEKAKRGISGDWTKSKMQRHISFTLVGTG